MRHVKWPKEWPCSEPPEVIKEEFATLLKAIPRSRMGDCWFAINEIGLLLEAIKRVNKAAS